MITDNKNRTCYGCDRMYYDNIGRAHCIDEEIENLCINNGFIFWDDIKRIIINIMGNHVNNNVISEHDIYDIVDKIHEEYKKKQQIIW